MVQAAATVVQERVREGGSEAPEEPSVGGPEAPGQPGASGATSEVPQRPMTLEEKAAEVKCCAQGRQRAGCAYLYDLEYQLAKSKYWCGSFLKDYFFFVGNWHPFLGMFFSHPCHPWTKRDRMLTTFVSCSITMLPSALLVQWGKHHGQAWISTAMIFAFITLPVGILEVALYWLAVGNIFCKGTRCHLCAVCVRGVHCGCIVISLVVSFSVLALSYMLMGDADVVELVRPFVISRLQSYLIWFPLFFLLPCIGFLSVWFREKRAVQKKCRGSMQRTSAASAPSTE